LIVSLFEDSVGRFGAFGKSGRKPIAEATPMIRIGNEIRPFSSRKIFGAHILMMSGCPASVAYYGLRLKAVPKA
jgi:hypothetical protein